jgi:hypothetical protein
MKEASEGELRERYFENDGGSSGTREDDREFQNNDDDNLIMSMVTRESFSWPFAAF